MIDHLRGMAVFAKTVEAGLFRGAARALGLSPSVVSHHVAQLEQSLDVALLYRSTRRLTLTREGERLFEAARAMVGAAEAGIEGLRGGARGPTGHLAVAAPAGLLGEKLLEDLAAFARALPRVQMTMRFSDAPLDLVREGIDVAFRAGTLKDSSLKSRRIGQFHRRLVAAPAYLAQRATPSEPAALAGWDWIRLGQRPPRVELHHASGRAVAFDIEARLVVDGAHALQRLVELGLGIGIVPARLAEREIALGRLVELLPEWRPEAPSIYAVWQANAPRKSLALQLIRHLTSAR